MGFWECVKSLSRQAATYVAIFVVMIGLTPPAQAGVILDIPSYPGYVAPTTPGDPRTYYAETYNTASGQRAYSTIYALNNNWFIGNTHFNVTAQSTDFGPIMATPRANVNTSSDPFVAIDYTIQLSGYSTTLGQGLPITLFHTASNLGFSQAQFYTGTINSSLGLVGSSYSPVVVNGQVVMDPGDKQTGGMKMNFNGSLFGMDSRYYVQDWSAQSGVINPRGLVEGDSGMITTITTPGPDFGKLVLMGDAHFANYSASSYFELGSSAPEINSIITTVPEPSSLVLLGIPVAGVAAIKRWRSRRRRS